MQLVVTFQDRALSEYAARLEQLSGNSSVVLAQELNLAGQAVRHATVAAETRQTGLKQGTIDRAQNAMEASAGRLAFTITSRGGNVRLKYFGPFEGGGGVTADPWNQSTLYPGAFMTSGRQGSRYLVSKLNGQVFERISGSRAWNKNTKAKRKSAIRMVRSGLFIPTEMTKGQTAAAFNEQAATLIATRIVSRLGSLLPG